MSEKKYTKKDFVSSREIKWCPGCGDYAILSAVQMAMAQLGEDKHKQCVISGIGCSSRFPVYMDTYGFHTIHGRAPTVVTGVKANRPDLNVWMITGDGDALSIGGNHFMHICRRNIDVVILLFNNRIYGLTKGQYSPTSEQNKITKSTPQGSIDSPINPLAYALSSSASFIARTYDTNVKHMIDTFKQAYLHKGTSIVEIFQNCVIFNDGAFNNVNDKKHNNLLFLENEQAMNFTNKNNEEKTLQFTTNGLNIVNKDSLSKQDITKFDNSASGQLLQYALTQLDIEKCCPMGVLRQAPRQCYEEKLTQQVNEAKKENQSSLQNLLNGHASWEIK